MPAHPQKESQGQVRLSSTRHCLPPALPLLQPQTANRKSDCSTSGGTERHGYPETSVLDTSSRRTAILSICAV